MTMADIALASLSGALLAVLTAIAATWPVRYPGRHRGET